MARPHESSALCGQCRILPVGDRLIGLEKKHPKESVYIKKNQPLLNNPSTS